MIYRKLRGGYSTLLGGGKLRLGDDHILAVYTYPIKESYRRFYLRDIQGITVTRRPRWALTNRSLLAGIVISFFLVSPLTLPYAGLLLGGLILAWLLLAFTAGCECRIYTEVSAETLPVRRIWAANALLEQVEPLIREAQRDIAVVVPGAAPIAHPLDEAPDTVIEHVQTPLLAVPPQALKPARLGVTLAFVLSLAVAAVLAAVHHYQPGVAAPGVLYGLILIQMGLALWMIIEHRRGGGTGARRLAIAYMVFLGIAGYAQLFLVSFGAAGRGAINLQNLYGVAPQPLFWDGYGVGCLLLMISSVMVLLSAPRGEPS